MKMIDLMSGFSTIISNEEITLLNKIRKGIIEREELNEREMLLVDRMVSRGIVERKVEFTDKISYYFDDPKNLRK